MLQNITLSADKKLVERARRRAAQEKSTLNQLFRRWLMRYVGATETRKNYEELMANLTYASATRPFSRDEMNER